MTRKGNGLHIFSLVAFIVITLIMVMSLAFVKDMDYMFFIASYIFAGVVYIIHSISSRLSIEEDISHNSIIIFRSFFGVNSLYIKQINKIIFIKRKNLFVRNIIYLYDNMGDALILDGNNRSYHQLLKVIIDKIKINKDVIIDKEMLEFLQINDSTLKGDQDRNSELYLIKEKIKNDRHIHLDNINSNLFKWILAALILPPIIRFIISFIIPAIVSLYLMLMDL